MTSLEALVEGLNISDRQKVILLQDIKKLGGIDDNDILYQITIIQSIIARYIGGVPEALRDERLTLEATIAKHISAVAGLNNLSTELPEILKNIKNNLNFWEDRSFLNAQEVKADLEAQVDALEKKKRKLQTEVSTAARSVRQLYMKLGIVFFLISFGLFLHFSEEKRALERDANLVTHCLEARPRILSSGGNWLIHIVDGTVFTNKYGTWAKIRSVEEKSNALW